PLIVPLALKMEKPTHPVPKRIGNQKGIRQLINLIGLLTVSLWTNPLLAEERGLSSIPPFNLFLRTFADGAGIDVQFKNIPINQLSEHGLGLSSLAQKVLAHGPQKIHVSLYLPEDISAVEKSQLVDYIENSLRKAHPESSVHIEPMIIDRKKAYSDFSEDQKAIEQELIINNTHDHQKLLIGRFLKALNNLKLAFNFVTRAQDIREALHGLKSPSSHTRDLSIATAVGVGKAVVNAIAWIGTSDQKSYPAIAAAVTGWGLDIWFARNAQRWVTWKKSSVLTWNRFGFGYLARLINKSEARRVFLVDQLNGLFWNLYFRTLAYLDKPHNTNPVFTYGALYDFWLPIVTGIVTEAPIASMSQVAINNLRQKGVFRSRQQFYWFLLFDLNYSIKSFLMQRGYSFLYWPAFFAEMFTRLTFIALNTITPAKETKLVFVSSKMTQEKLKDILHTEGIVLPEDPIKGPLESEMVLQDWLMRSQTHLASQSSHQVAHNLIHHFEKVVKTTHQFLVLSNAQRVTGIDLLNLNTQIDELHRKTKEFKNDLHQACASIFRIWR
ncbi:MAG: hypothetical protein NZ480_00255, partial [Bdellovibrionaceae bacterium]|nr:hypothetical protein [Pseudobdellovibrionaceae bacterium]